MSARKLLAALLASTALGCQTLNHADDKPARIVNADEASRAALQEAVNAAIKTNVILADDALTESSVLTIERTPPQTMANPTPQGRVMEMPIQLKLVMNGEDCILVDQRDQSRYALANTRCEAE